MEEQNSKRPLVPQESKAIERPARNPEEHKRVTPIVKEVNRALLGDNSGKNRFAAFITRDMVNVLAQIKEAKELVANGIKAVEHAEGEILNIRRDVSGAEEALEAIEVNEANDRRHTQLEKDQSYAALAYFKYDLDQAEKRAEKFKKRLNSDENVLLRMREKLEENFAEALKVQGPSGHLDIGVHPATQYVEEYAGTMGASTYGWKPPTVETNYRTPEALRLQAARDTLERSVRDLTNAQIRFDSRHDHYAQALAHQQQLLRSGKRTKHTFTDFGLRDIQRVRRLTRDLTAAEAAHKAAKQHARDLGLPQSDPYQTSDFLDRDDDGYAESEVTEDDVTGVGRAGIERWKIGIAHAQMTGLGLDPVREAAGVADVDDWDSGTVGMDDSASAVDCDRYCGKIRGWERHCGDLRVRFAGIASANALGDSEERLGVKRRRSC